MHVLLPFLPMEKKFFPVGVMVIFIGKIRLVFVRFIVAMREVNVLNSFEMMDVILQVES